MVGTFGSEATRCADATPSILTLPAATCGITAVGAAQLIGIWPASRSLSASAAPRYGTLTMSTLASAFSINSAEMMRRADAGRADRELARLGLGERDQFAALFGPNEAARTASAARSRPARSARSPRPRRTARLLCSHLCSTDEVSISSSVWPSGAALATESVPTMPPAAGAVLDHHRLLQPLLQFLGDQPAGGIDAAAGADRHHDGDLARRIELRVRGLREQPPASRRSMLAASCSSAVLPFAFGQRSPAACRERQTCRLSGPAKAHKLEGQGGTP